MSDKELRDHLIAIRTTLGLIAGFVVIIGVTIIGELSRVVQ